MASLIASDLHGGRHISPSALTTVVNDGPTPEHYRQIYVGLHFQQTENPRVIGITSSISGEGRTTVALGLAQTLASDLGMPIVLVEADLERPSLAPHFGLPPSPGLSEVLRGECRLDEVLRDVSANLMVVTTGVVDGSAPRLFHLLAEQPPFRGLRPAETLVIMDMPPIINHSYSQRIASIADALVLVVRAGVTPTDVVSEAVARLEHCPPQGVVLNGQRLAGPRRGG